MKGIWHIVDEQSFLLLATRAVGTQLQIDTASLDPKERRN